MAVELRGTPTHGDSGSGTLTISTPTGVQAGDLLIAAIVSSLDGSTPSGWTLSRSSSKSEAGYFKTLYRVATSSEPSSHSFAGLGASQAGTISAFSGVDSAAPHNAYATPTGAASGTSSLSSPGVTTTVDGCLILRLFGLRANNASRSVTPPASHTDIYDQMVLPELGSDYIGGEASHLTQISAGATGTASATASANVTYDAHTIAIAPGAPALVIPDLVGAVTG